MDSLLNRMLTDAEKDGYIATLTPHLAILRTQAGVSQEELANFVGISRQTYSAIERKVRRMSWHTYLSLIFFFDHNKRTHQLLRQLSIYPSRLISFYKEICPS